MYVEMIKRIILSSKNNAFAKSWNWYSSWLMFAKWAFPMNFIKLRSLKFFGLLYFIYFTCVKFARIDNPQYCASFEYIHSFGFPQSWRQSFLDSAINRLSAQGCRFLFPVAKSGLDFHSYRLHIWMQLHA